MGGPPPRLPQPLLAELVHIDDPLLVSRYQAALEAVGLPPTSLRRFHVDAAGYSPEIAAERRDPFYLGAHGLHAQALLVCDAQLSARLVHPSLGFAVAAFSRSLARWKRELSELLVRESLVAELRGGASRLAHIDQLAGLEVFEIRLRTPSGLLRDLRQLEEMKTEFLESERFWLDEEGIAGMLALAKRLRGAAPPPAALVRSSQKLGPFYTPAFGGSYVVTETAGRRPTTFVLCSAKPDTAAEPNEKTRRMELEVRELADVDVLDFLNSHGIAGFDPAHARARAPQVEQSLHWIAVDHLLARGCALRGWRSAEVERQMREQGEAPPLYRELEDLAQRLRAGRRIEQRALTPAAQLRLLAATSTRPAVRAFVRHLLAGLDAANLERSWRDAPDLFFARVNEAGAPALAHLAQRLEERPSHG